MHTTINNTGNEYISNTNTQGICACRFLYIIPSLKKQNDSRYSFSFLGYVDGIQILAAFQKEKAVHGKVKHGCCVMDEKLAVRIWCTSSYFFCFSFIYGYDVHLCLQMQLKLTIRLLSSHSKSPKFFNYISQVPVLVDSLEIAIVTFAANEEICSMVVENKERKYGKQLYFLVPS